MLNLVVMYIFPVLDWKYLYLAHLAQKYETELSKKQDEIW